MKIKINLEPNVRLCFIVCVVMIYRKERTMENTIIKILLYDNQVRLLFVNHTPLLNEIMNQNMETNKTQKLILGKVISAISIITGILKDEQRISLQLTMSNRDLKVFADADANGNVRGYLSKSFQGVADKGLDMKHLIGNKGMIQVIKGSAMNQFTGVTDMPYGTIDEDISYYFNQSEQTYTYVDSMIQFDKANHITNSTAIFAQLLPGASPTLLNQLVDKIKENHVFFTELQHMEKYEIEKAVRTVFQDAKVIGYSPIQFFCECTKEMFYGMIYSLSKKELETIVQHDESMKTVCQICGTSYTFTAKDIQVLLTGM